MVRLGRKNTKDEGGERQIRYQIYTRSKEDIWARGYNTGVCNFLKLGFGVGSRRTSL